MSGQRPNELITTMLKNQCAIMRALGFLKEPSRGSMIELQQRLQQTEMLLHRLVEVGKPEEPVGK
jgi:hypothetical protein